MSEPGAVELGTIIVDPGTSDEAAWPLVDRLFVGRECAGVDDSRRILVTDDPAVSRNHLEVRVDSGSSSVVVVDTSSNGTRINGVRIERSVGVPLAAGDRIQVGRHVLEFRTQTVVARGSDSAGHRSTVSLEAPTKMALLAGDLINYSTVSEQADHQVLAHDIDRLYSELRELLSHHHGTLIDYVGDAFFASWELEVDPSAPIFALQFALAASERVSEITPTFDLRYADGSPLRMGWGASMGEVVLRLMPGSVVMALGDATNVAFRISALAGRDHRPQIIATEAVRRAAEGSFRFGEPETVLLKGRVATETIYGVLAR